MSGRHEVTSAEAYDAARSRAYAVAHGDSIAEGDEGLTFGQRLRAERERRKISIASIAESTKILGALLEGLEHDDVSRWPNGIYRRAFIRAYARAIGLDPEPIVREFAARFPEPDQAPPTAPAAHPAAPRPRTVLRLTLADSAGSRAGGDVVSELRRRSMAVAADVVVLGAIGGGLYAVIGALWAPLALAVVAYYLGGILLLGNSPGISLVASISASPPRRSAAPRPRGSARASLRASLTALRLYAPEPAEGDAEPSVR
jgi:transcriptional regulator with XRE-family HTH domain